MKPSNTPAASSVHVIININGKTLFDKNCSACQSVRKTDAMMISDVERRINGSALLHEWIRNSSKVLRSGNLYFNALIKDNGGVMMSNFPNLTDQQIDDILDYMREAEFSR